MQAHHSFMRVAEIGVGLHGDEAISRVLKIEFFLSKYNAPSPACMHAPQFKGHFIFMFAHFPADLIDLR